MLQQMLKELGIPALKSREEMVSLLEREVYGKVPQKPEKVTYEIKENVIPKFCAGKASCHKVQASFVINGKEYSFPFHTILPTAEGKHPFFVMPNFRPDIPDRHMPAEEIIDRGFAVLTFCYQDVTSDNDDFTNGLAGILYEDGKRKSTTDPGKISMWAWAAMRILDYAEENLSDVLDLKRATICGHSRLGKTALWTAANDSRFAFAYSNDSGCGGASLTRGKVGESVDDICRRFSYWFCENYWQYRGKENSMPFDQHYLIASIAPRKVLVGSASKDQWADPKNEFLSCVAASPTFEKGLVHENRLPGEDEVFMEGDLAYHIRPGLHYFSRTDWNRLCDFVLLKTK